MTDIYKWSTVSTSAFAANGNADSAISIVEGSTARADVNDGMRAMMGRVAQFIDDIAGVVTVGGTADVITVTTKSPFSALVDGIMIRLPVASDNTGAVTLNPNTIGATAVKKIVSGSATALSAGDLRAGTRPLLIYVASLSAFIVVSGLESSQAASTTVSGIVELLTAAELWTGTDTGRVASAAILTAALAPVTITDGATVTADLQAGINFVVALGGNRTLAFSNYASKVGQSGFIKVTESGAARTLDITASYLKTANGVDFVLGDGSGTIHTIYYSVISATEIVLSRVRAIA